MTKSQSEKTGLEDKQDNNGTLSKESWPSVVAEGTWQRVVLVMSVGNTKTWRHTTVKGCKGWQQKAKGPWVCAKKHSSWKWIIFIFVSFMAILGF